MDIRNRMHDVIKLRCNALQDFLRLIICDEWQQFIYNKAQNEVVTNGKYRDKYIADYQKMREKGIKNYCVEDMDVTFISEVIHGCKKIAPTKDQTRIAIRQLVEDRNITDHSNENEDKEELYLRGLLDLCSLKKFVSAVDKFENEIEDERRLAFFRKYTFQIEELKEKLDQERILLIQRSKAIEHDVKLILQCENRASAWGDVEGLYLQHLKIDGDIEQHEEFIIKASDAGIVQAHGNAADIFINRKKDYIEGERRLIMLCNSYDKLPSSDAHCIMCLVNDYLSKGNLMTEGMNKIIDRIISQGHPISRKNNGLFLWER